MVFQNYALYPHMTVFDNMAFGLQAAEFPKDEIKRRVDEAAPILDIEPLLERQARRSVRRAAPARRHGPRDRAQAQGVPVRRAAVQPRRQAARSQDAHRDQKRCIRRCKTTTVYVTHDQVEAMTLADRVVVMPRDHRAGRYAAGTLTAADPFRRRLHRVAGDELHALPDRGRGAGGISVHVNDQILLPIPQARVGLPAVSRASRWCSACGRSICSNITTKAGRVGERVDLKVDRRGRADGHGNHGLFP